jgi:hypothetical protein
MSMTWMIVIGVAAAVLVAVRILLSLRRLRHAQADDWDARQVRKLRQLGNDPFKLHDIDFFFGLPDAPACERLQVILVAEGCVVSYHMMPEHLGTGYSLHARKQLRLSVTDIQEHSARYRALAAQYAAAYDGWNAVGDR